MKSFIINIKNLLPYFLLIIIYFLFVNLEARKDESRLNKDRIIDYNKLQKEKSYTTNSGKRIQIPVIPYNK